MMNIIVIPNLPDNDFTLGSSDWIIEPPPTYRHPTFITFNGSGRVMDDMWHKAHSRVNFNVSWRSTFNYFAGLQVRFSFLLSQL